MRAIRSWRNQVSLQYVSARALIAAALFGSPAYAQDDAPETEPEIVVTAPLEGSSIESLQGAMVLSRDDVVENLNGGLGNSLDALPGVATTFYGVGASRPIIRGLGEDRVRVLDNGVGAIDASSASPDHALTADGLDASRIEVLRGAAALAYGGNAVGGVINVLDESIPTHETSDPLNVDALASYQSGNDGGEASVGLTADAGAVLFRLSASARETGDYDIPGFANIDGTGVEGSAPNSWTSFRAYGAGASLVRDWGFAGAAIKRTTDEYGLPPEPGETQGGHIELEQTRIESRGNMRVPWGPFTRLDFGLQHADYQHTEFEANGEPGTTFTNDGWEARVEAHHRREQLQGAVGLQASDSDFAAVGDEGFITPTNMRDAGAFVIERWDAGAWGLEGGGRLENRHVDNEVGGARDFTPVSASLGAFMRPAQNWFVAATLGRTERAPTATELFADGPHLATFSYEVGDSDNDIETALSFEASARYTTDSLTFELNLYRIAFSDYIALVNRGDVWWSDEATETSGFAPSPDDLSIPADATALPVFAFVQQDATFTGGEISASARLFEALGFVWRVTGALDLVRAEFDAGGDLPRIPPRTATLGLEAENTNWKGRVEFVDVAEQDDVGVLETPTDGYQFVNARLAWRPWGESGPLTLSLNGRNLGDEEGRVHTSFLKNELPLPGRSVRFVLSSAF
jgi:iron complex outermembrane receptor protein